MTLELTTSLFLKIEPDPRKKKKIGLKFILKSRVSLCFKAISCVYCEGESRIMMYMEVKGHFLGVNSFLPPSHHVDSRGAQAVHLAGWSLCYSVISLAFKNKVSRVYVDCTSYHKL